MYAASADATASEGVASGQSGYSRESTRMAKVWLRRSRKPREDRAEPEHMPPPCRKRRVGAEADTSTPGHATQ